MASPRFLLAAVAALLALHVQAQGLPIVRGEPSLAPKAVATARLRLGPLDAPAAPGRHYRLAPMAEELAADLRARNQRGWQKRFAIGANRDVPSPDATVPLAWTRVEGGYAARTSLTSPGAASMRLAIDLLGVPENVQMVFAGSGAPDRVEGPVRVGEVPDRSAPYWSPLTEGETQAVEFFVPEGTDPASLAPRLVQASHVFTTLSSGLAKSVADIGSAGACNVDVACSSLNTSSAQGTAYRNAVAATAQIVVTEGNGTYKCTGTLLNDTDTSAQVPWFYTANHCFDNSAAPFKTRLQIQSVANTMQTLWFFEATACRSGVVNPGWVQLPGGATVMYQSPDNDVMFMRLNRTPPAGAFYAGWDANPVNTGSAVITLHHPHADLKKVTVGTVKGYTSMSIATGAAQSSFIEMTWTSGTTEGGSSGSGYFTWSGLEYALRGGEFGGYATCATPAESDFYSRLDMVYPSLQPYLAPSATPFADVTDLWWGGESESGWGLNLIQHPTNMVFGVWYTYGLDGKRTWYVLPSGTWTDSRTYTGTIYATAGPAADGPFDPSLVKTNAVGSGTLHFTDASNGTFAYSINGISGTKSITRQPF